MYRMLLSKLSDKEKIGITAHLAKEVLGEAVEGDGDLARVCQEPVNDNNNNKASIERYMSALELMRDAFAILVSPKLRMGKTATSNTNINNDTEDANNVASVSQQVVAAKGGRNYNK
jgi:uncharacterized protein YgfB (UPF0149 family)